MFRRILVPLDGSSLAEKALPFAAHLAQVSGGTIILAHVSNLAIEYGPYLAQPFVYTESTLEIDIASAQSYLDGVAHSPLLRGMMVQREAISGEVAQSILNLTQSTSADLIVMCSHGRTGFTRWAMGSIAQKVAQYSVKPVFIVRSDDTTELADAVRTHAHPIRVLVGLDGSPLAETALLPAAQLCAALNDAGKGMLHLLRVVHLLEETRDENSVIIQDMNEQKVKNARAYLHQIEQRVHTGNLATFGLTVNSSIVSGSDAANILVRDAEAGESCDDNKKYDGCDIIALATHGYGGLQRWVMGSVVERVLGSTKLPTLVVRSTEIESYRHQPREQVAY